MAVDAPSDPGSEAEELCTADSVISSLHDGQVVAMASHAPTQAAWYRCEHGSTATSSPAENAS